MKWNVKSGSIAKYAAAGLSAFTMCITPLAQGAEAKATQKKMISQYLRETGLTTGKITVGEYWKMVRHVYPPKFQKEMDVWASLNRTKLMPQIEATTFNGPDGEQVRLNLTSEGQTASLTFTGDPDRPVKFGGVSLTRKEMTHVDGMTQVFAKIAKQDAGIAKAINAGRLKSVVSDKGVLTYAEFKKLLPRQKAEYFIRLRLAAEAAQRVYTTRYGLQASQDLEKKHEWAYRFLFGLDAEAKSKASGLTGKPCIVAGYISKYGENGSCGGNEQGARDLADQMAAGKASCSGGAVACNPMVYGFNGSGGAFCVARAQVKYATRECNKQSPLQDADPKKEALNKKRIVESYLKKVKGQDINLVLNDENKISEDQYSQVAAYFEDLQGYINSAITECGQSPLKDIQVKREDQVSACEELKTRAFALQAFANRPEPVDPGGQNCGEQMPGSSSGDDGCGCAEGTKKGTIGEKGREIPGCVVVDGGTDLPPAKNPPAETCGFFCRNKNVLLIGGLLIGIGALAWFMTRDKDKKKNPPVYEPPAPPIEPIPSPTATATVTPPPPAPCPEPNTLVNGVCTPPVVVEPNDEGGTKVDDIIRGGGVR